MVCDRWQEAISARLDGEDPGIDRRLLDAHVARCPSCRAYTDAAAARRAAAPLAAAATPPDLSRRVARLAAAADRAASWNVARVLLAVVAVEIIVFSVPELLGDEPGSVAVHTTRHLGAFTVAYAVALLVVVARPARARAVLPVAIVLAGALVLGAAVDLIRGRVPIIDESRHLPELASVLLLWLVAAPGPLRRPSRGDRHPSAIASVAVPDTDSKSLTRTRAATSQSPGNDRSTEAS
jgi:predicted anti-sigma-YlaC factor YlaD